MNTIKEPVHQKKKRKILLFTHSHLIPNLYVILSPIENKSKNKINSLTKTCSIFELTKSYVFGMTWVLLVFSFNLTHKA